MGVIDFILALMQDMILSAIPALGFAMVFNVPHRALPWCALLGALGHGSRMVMMTAGFNIEWSTFMASLLVVVCRVSEITTLAHQFAAQVRMRGETIATVQPEQVVDQQEFTH